MVQWESEVENINIFIAEKKILRHIKFKMICLIFSSIPPIYDGDFDIFRSDFDDKISLLYHIFCKCKVFFGKLIHEI